MHILIFNLLDVMTSLMLARGKSVSEIDTHWQKIFKPAKLEDIKACFEDCTEGKLPFGCVPLK